MATSDNVVRGGLTPKLKDADTLAKMLVYKQQEYQIEHGEEHKAIGGIEREYRSGFAEFKVS